MPNLEEEEEEETKTSVVSYARFDETDASTEDFDKKLNQYVWENLPLNSEQKERFRLMLVAQAAVDREQQHTSKEEDE
jgi:hypothetical protein